MRSEEQSIIKRCVVSFFDQVLLYKSLGLSDEEISEHCDEYCVGEDLGEWHRGYWDLVDRAMDERDARPDFGNGSQRAMDGLAEIGLAITAAEEIEECIKDHGLRSFDELSKIEHLPTRPFDFTQENPGGLVFVWQVTPGDNIPDPDAKWMAWMRLELYDDYVLYGRVDPCDLVPEALMSMLESLPGTVDPTAPIVDVGDGGST